MGPLSPGPEQSRGRIGACEPPSGRGTPAPPPRCGGAPSQHAARSDIGRFRLPRHTPKGVTSRISPGGDALRAGTPGQPIRLGKIGRYGVSQGSSAPGLDGVSRFEALSGPVLVRSGPGPSLYSRVSPLSGPGGAVRILAVSLSVIRTPKTGRPYRWLSRFRHSLHPTSRRPCCPHAGLHSF